MRKHISLQFGKFYIRVFLVLLVMSFIIILFLSLSFHEASTKATIDEVTSITQKMLSINNYHSDFIYNQIVRLGAELIVSSQIEGSINNYFSLKESNALIEYHTIRELSSKKESFGFVYSIGLYNSFTKSIIYTTGATYEDHSTIINNINSSNQNRILVFPHIVYPDSNIPTNILSFVLFDNTDNVNGGNAVIIEIYDSILGEYAPNNERLNQGQTFIINNKGIVLHHQNRDLFMSNLINEKYIQSILKLEVTQGSMIDTISNEDTLVTFYKNKETMWTIVNILPYEYITQEIDHTRNSILIVSFFAFVSAFIAAILLSTYLYIPISRLTSWVNSENVKSKKKTMFREFDYLKYEFMSNKVKLQELSAVNISNLMDLRNRFLYKLLLGEINLELISQITEKYDIKLPTNDFKLILFALDLTKDVYHQPYSETFILEKIRQKFSEIPSYFCISMSREKWAVILTKQTEQNFINLDEALQEIQNLVKINQLVSMSICISDTITNINDISSVYSECLELLKYRLMYGAEMLIKSIDTIVDNNYKYPIQEEQAVIDSIRINSKEKYLLSIERLLENALKFSFFDFENTIYQVSYECIKQINDILRQRNSSVSLRVYEMNEELANSYGILQIKNWFENLFDNFQNIIRSIDNNSNTQILKMQTLMEYIDTNFNNPDLNIDLISSIGNISPGYFSRLFKKINKITFTEYISRLRVERAKQLLVNTSCSIEEISIKSGFNSINYFYSFFKKNMGITPLQYRQFIK